ncbi:MAG TPA: folylpolyglutamate synthase/dihydrofolate synthase family protein [bacterium]|nr:MAG: Folylpolyglutamate synthase [bacterium ADurb.Bin236]HPI76102.1 folylpolyglutamate synthase/dihydrofolate synthase family protein [bacterium]HPN93658.1 folylpolyglutamate synthase/dihydrofolate synthase family protein [bacterium]
MKYSEAIAYLDNFSNWEKRAHKLKARFTLTQIRSLMSLMGNPQRSIKAVHIAGTVGKGSVCHMLESVARAAGYSTGLYTSPHLNDIRERVRFDGEMISKKAFGEAVARVAQFAGRDFDKYTYFEIITAAAIGEFAARGVDIAIIETGLGGRLDATNIVEPLVSVITTIGWDHQHVLGNRMTDIAREKAGIIKSGGRAVSAPQRAPAARVLREVAEKKNAALSFAAPERLVTAVPNACDSAIFRARPKGLPKFDVLLPLEGEFQKINMSVVMETVDALRASGFYIDSEEMKRGFESVEFPGRMELVRPSGGGPDVLLDGAHNETAARALARHLSGRPSKPKIALVVSMMKDKDAESALRELRAISGEIVVAGLPYDRAWEPEPLAKIASIHFRKVRSAPDIATALKKAAETAGANGLVCVTGSLYAVAAAKEVLD